MWFLTMAWLESLAARESSKVCETNTRFGWMLGDDIMFLESAKCIAIAFILCFCVGINGDIPLR